MRFLILFFLFYTVFFCGCIRKNSKSFTEANTGKVELVITPFAGHRPLHLDSTYRNSLGEEYSVKALRFFISDIAFSHSTGKEFPVSSEDNKTGIYFINYNRPNFDAGYGAQSYKLEFDATAGQYSDVRFSVGVPREVNHSDPAVAPPPLNTAQADEMYWEWNSGYIFFLAEGKIHNEKDDRFHFAIGNDSRIMPLSFGNLFDIVPLIHIEEGKTTRVNFALDFNKLMENGDKSFYSLNIPDQAAVHGGHHADVLRNNLMQSFKFISAEVVE